MICIFHAHNESSNLKYDCNNTTIYNVYKQVGSKIPHKLWLQRPRQLRHWLFYTTILKGGEKMSINRESRSVPEFSLLLLSRGKKDSIDWERKVIN